MPPIIEPAIARRFMIRLKTSGDLCGVAGAPTSVMVPSRFSKVVKIVEIMWRSYCIQNEIETLQMSRHLIGIA